MFNDDPAELARKLAELRIEHRDLDIAIALLPVGLGCDELVKTRMKKTQAAPEGHDRLSGKQADSRPGRVRPA